MHQSQFATEINAVVNSIGVIVLCVYYGVMSIVCTQKYNINQTLLSFDRIKEEFGCVIFVLALIGALWFVQHARETGVDVCVCAL